MKKIHNIILAVILVYFISCEEHSLIPSGNDGKAPGKIQNVQIEPVSGGAIISYENPTDEDLLYVIAEYSPKPGVELESRVSLYKNSILVEGFIDTLEHEVKIYAVDRSENKSEAYIAKVKPLSPPILNVYKTISIKESFGGIRLSWINTDEAPLSLLLFAADSLGVLKNVKTVYTESDTARYALRGFDESPREFAVIVRDRWDNYSDTIKGTFTPWFEEQLPISYYKKIILPGDENWNEWGGKYEYLYDGDVKNNMAHSWNKNIFPDAITFDLGTLMNISRFKFWQRGMDPNWAYDHYNIEEFELYGMSEEPPSDGSWDSWEMIGKFKAIKPSGSPRGTNTEEDMDAFYSGHEFEMPDNMPSYRYIRMSVTRTWDEATDVNLSEIAFFGKILDK